MEKKAYKRAMAETQKRGGPTIRARWDAPSAIDAIVRRQDSDDAGDGYDGSQGIDNEDISNTPGIDYSVRPVSISRFAYRRNNNFYRVGNILPMRTLTDRSDRTAVGAGITIRLSNGSTTALSGSTNTSRPPKRTLLSPF